MHATGLIFMPFKVVISDPKTRRAYQKELDSDKSGLINRKLGEKLSADFIGLSGYEVEITGGSDKEGFPMRKDVEGPGRKKILLSAGPGFYPKLKGQRKRKSIRGNTISEATSQINLKIVKHGPKSVEELLGVTPKEEKKELTDEEKLKQKQEEAKKLAEQMTDKPQRATKAEDSE